MNHRKHLLTRFLEEVWNQGDIGAADRYIAPKYTIHHDPGDPWHGRELDRDAYKERLRVSRAPFPDQRFDVSQLIADGDAVVATWFWSGTHVGDFPGFPATGRQVRMSGATVYYFEEDLIAGHWQMVDRLGVFQQLANRAPLAS